MDGSKDETENEDMREERQEFELKASDEAIKYLSSISKEDWNDILFTENLMSTSKDAKITSELDFGELEISVCPGEWNKQECYVIHVTEENIINNIPRVTNIIAHVDQTFTTLEQSFHEYIKVADKNVDKKTLMVLENGKYVVQRTVTQDDFKRKTHETYSVKQLQGFVCEGCHVVIQRILLRKAIPDDMVFLTFDSEANLSKMTFKLAGEREVEIENQQVGTIGIHSTIFSPLEPERAWNSFFLTNSQLVIRNEIGSTITVQLSHLPRPPTPEEPLVITPLKWEEDMQLFSQFMDRKEELMDDHRTYIRRHPELHAILADFLQFLLLRKPDNVFEFARDFFHGMSLASDNSNQ